MVALLVLLFILLFFIHSSKNVQYVHILAIDIMNDLFHIICTYVYYKVKLSSDSFFSQANTYQQFTLGQYYVTCMYVSWKEYLSIEYPSHSISKPIAEPTCKCKDWGLYQKLP